MFEKTMPSQSAFAPGILPQGATPSQSHDELRAVVWCELAARLNAARDLRFAMRAESDTGTVASGQAAPPQSGESFEYADHERVVNRDVLEARKASNAITAEDEGGLARGDEETIYD